MNEMYNFDQNGAKSEIEMLQDMNFKLKNQHDELLVS